jgi:hypothetical protein
MPRTADIDQKGDCDLSVNLYMIPGSVPGRTNQVAISYSDNARFKANVKTDEQWLFEQADSQMKQITRTPGAQPKL